jgi:hypothetical protein
VGEERERVSSFEVDGSGSPVDHDVISPSPLPPTLFY